MIPGEMFPAAGEIELNAGREAMELDVANTGDRPVQVGSHYHFAAINPALSFDRDAARGAMHAPELVIGLDLGQGHGIGEAFGCDLTEAYVVENSEYTT